MASTVRLLLHQSEGRTLQLVVPGYQGALDNHVIVDRRYPGDDLVEAATNPAFEPLQPPRSPWVCHRHRHYDPVVSPRERRF